MLNTYKHNLEFLKGFEERNCSLATTKDSNFKIVVEDNMEFFISQSLHQELAAIFGLALQLQVKFLIRQVRTTRLLSNSDPVLGF